jgi:hypothetical protein
MALNADGHSGVHLRVLVNVLPHQVVKGANMWACVRNML